jgi:hypothetical protein
MSWSAWPSRRSSDHPRPAAGPSVARVANSTIPRPFSPYASIGGRRNFEDWPLIAPNSGNDTIADIGRVVRSVNLALRAIVDATVGAVKVLVLVEGDRCGHGRHTLRTGREFSGGVVRECSLMPVRRTALTSVFHEKSRRGGLIPRCWRLRRQGPSSRHECLVAEALGSGDDRSRSRSLCLSPRGGHFVDLGRAKPRGVPNAPGLLLDGTMAAAGATGHGADGLEPCDLLAARRSRQGTWAQLVEAWRPYVETDCGDCQESIWLGSEDSAVVARVVDGRVVMTIQGAAAIARIFPTVPDSVTLSRKRPDTDEEEITIGVERRRP